MTIAIAMLIVISHAALGPAPKTIGNGPMKITPPTLEEPPATNDAITTKIMPIMITAKPTNKTMSNLLEISTPSSGSDSLVSSVIRASPQEILSNNYY